MQTSSDRLFDLLPSLYRLRDAEQGWSLRALLQVISEQLNIVENDIDQLYENWFIETCDDWVVPYIGDLVGYRLLHDAGKPVSGNGGLQTLRNRILIPRQEVANTLRNRRRKGSLALLELLADDVAGWPARAVEFYTLINIAQHVNHLRTGANHSSVNIRDVEALENINSPFDTVAHNVDVRRPASKYICGKYNIPDIGLFIWRLRSYSITKAVAHHVDSSPNCYTFSILGNDVPLYRKPVTETDPDKIAAQNTLPVPISRKQFKRNPEEFYGEDKCLFLWTGEEFPEEPVPVEKIVMANLEKWENSPPADKIAIDPQLGRIVYGLDEGPAKKDNVWVLYHYGFPADYGGGEYERSVIQPSQYDLGAQSFSAEDLKDSTQLIRLLNESQDTAVKHLNARITAKTGSEKGKNTFVKLSAENVNEQLNRLISGKCIYEEKAFKNIRLSDEVNLLLKQVPQGNTLKHLNRLLLEQLFPNFIRKSILFYRVGLDEKYSTIMEAFIQWQEDNPLNAVIEISDNREYVEQLDINLEEKQSLQIRAANRKRPSIRIVDLKGGRMDAWTVTGGQKSHLTIDGLLISGRGLQIEGAIGYVSLRHTTLVPGWEIDIDCRPDSPTEPSLFLINTEVRLDISHSIVGSIQVEADEVQNDPAEICISDSVVDATAPGEEAIGAPGNRYAFAEITILRSTIIGIIQAHAVKLIENSIIDCCMNIARKQQGCIRFSYISPRTGDRTPKRFNCQPDLVIRNIRDMIKKGQLDANKKAVLESLEIRRVRPRFNSTRYGSPAYLQLMHSTAEEIKRGADDESEMGVYHDLFQPQRESNLRIRLQEYTAAGMEAGIFYIS